MSKKESKISDQRIFNIVRNIFAGKYGQFQRTLDQIVSGAKFKFVSGIPYECIKNSLLSIGKDVSYMSVKTDGGRQRKSKPDGGVVYVEYNDVFYPVLWVESKSSNSCLHNNGTRGQATGLICEQEERCRDWYQLTNCTVKPLLVFMSGSDFNEENGTYNIGRIRDGLHTNGNVNPYIDEQNPICCSWFFFQENFTDDELINIIDLALEENFNRLCLFLENTFGRKTSIFDKVKKLIFQYAK